MHRPPETAVFRVSQLTISPASSLWKDYISREVSNMGQRGKAE